MTFSNGVYKEETTEEIKESKRIEKQQQIADLKAQLQATDYKLFKNLEGWLTDDEYAPIKAERQKIRDKINELESE